MIRTLLPKILCRLALVLGCLLSLGGCSSMGMTVLDRPQLQDSESGWIVVSSDVDTSRTTQFVGLFSTINRVELNFVSDQEKHCGRVFLHVTPNVMADNDFVYPTGERGNLFVAQLPKGSYTLCAWDLDRGNATAIGGFDFPFVVEPGKILYLGSFRFDVVDWKVHVEWMNAYDRDMDLFEKRMAPVKRSDVMYVIPLKLPVLGAPLPVLPAAANAWSAGSTPAAPENR